MRELGDIVRFTQLRVLDLSANDVASLLSIANLPLLEELKASFNGLVHFDLPVSTLPCLTLIDVAYN